MSYNVRIATQFYAIGNNVLISNANIGLFYEMAKRGIYYQHKELNKLQKKITFVKNLIYAATF